MIKVKSTQHGSLTDLEKQLSLPVRQIGEALATSIATRMQRGEGPNGPTRPYSDGEGRIWVPPKGHQPDGDKYRIRHGAYRGWAIYPDARTYRDAAGKGDRRDYRATGWLWERAFTVRVVSPRHTQIYFRGTHGPSGMRADRLAAQVSADEPGGLLTPSSAELAMVTRMAEESITDQLAGALGAQEAAFRARGQLASLQRRTAKTLGIGTQLLQALTLR